MAILSVNAGSSSLKFALYPVIKTEVQPHILSGLIEGLEPGGQPQISWAYQGQKHTQMLALVGEHVFTQALLNLRELLSQLPGAPDLQAVSHRVVHGADMFRASLVVTDVVLAQLAAYNSLAPLHQPHNLAGIRAFRAAFPDLPQIACFDTAFHASLPEVDFRFALPHDLYAQGLRRYGFHGLSYQYVMGALLAESPRAKDRTLMAHLGNGASLCAAHFGKSCATTMGFSALDGLMMGTRTGVLDPGELLYLLEQGWDHARLQKLLYRQSGLLGMSGLSADMRTLRASAAPEAKLAIDAFTYRVVRETGALVACMQGLDVLAFTGGIGEHDVILRAEVGQKLAWLGVLIDPERNAQATGNGMVPIHTPASRVEVWVVPTDEGLIAAREAAALLAA